MGSLQATWIRNTILHALRESTSVETRSIPDDFVYQHPTLASLAQYVSSLTGPPLDETGHQNDSTTNKTVAAMLAMVNKYRTNFPKHVPSTTVPTKDVVLVTGTTGSLGSTLLSRLLKIPEVEHIYALNRPGDEGRELLQRQRDRLVEWGLDPEIIHSPKVTFLESDMSEDRLGLPVETYNKVSSRSICY